MKKINFFKSKLFFNLIITVIVMLYILNTKIGYHNYWGYLTIPQVFSASFSSSIVKFAIQAIIVNYLIIMLLLHNYNKATKIVSYVGYIGMLIVELLFALVLFGLMDAFTPNIKLIMLIVITVVWIIFLFMFKEEEVKVSTTMKIARKTETVNNDSDDTVSKLKEYKELLDSGVITKSEFDDMKKALLNKELKRVKE